MGEINGESNGNWRKIGLPLLICILVALTLTNVVLLLKNSNEGARELQVRGLEITVRQAMQEKYTPENWPCDPPVDLRTSDLCAQWKAADAARDGANWTLWSFMVGTLVNAATLVFVGMTFLQTRKGTEAAITAAESAVRALDTERARMLPRQIYMRLTADVASDLTVKEVDKEFFVIWENFGGRPAVGVVTSLGFSNLKPDELPSIDNEPIRHHGEYTTVGPGETVKTPGWFTGTGEIGIFLSTDRVCYLNSSVSYADALDRNKKYREHVLFRVTVRQPHEPGLQDLIVSLDDIVIKDGKAHGAWYDLLGLDKVTVSHFQRPPTAEA